MLIGDLLVANNLVSAADVEMALDHQRVNGGRLGDVLVAMGKLQASDLDAVMNEAPAAPRTTEESGTALPTLLNLVMKAMYVGSAETPSAIAEILRLPNRVILSLIENLKERKLLEVLGAAGIRAVSELRYTTTEKGKQWALEALSQNQYLGPAPVSLTAYSDRIVRQRIANERVDRGSIAAAFADLVISEAFIRQVGPAVNSGQSILLYGPPGNGKTTVASKIGQMFRDVVYIPYCFEVDGQIIKVFDQGVHEPIAHNSPAGGSSKVGLRGEDIDRRWVPCKRPFLVAGGELTLEMLDLSFEPLAKFYEAPLHVKAMGGIFMIDDFGRQLVSPEALLNRWIVPLERHVDYLKLHTGKSFSLPFDELVIFSTNLSPSQLIDTAFLRRIPYKLEIAAPSAAEYKKIFRAIAKARGLEASDQAIDGIIGVLRDRNGIALASYQPKFIIDQVLDACKFEHIAPVCRPDMIAMAIGNLSTESAPPIAAAAE